MTPDQLRAYCAGKPGAWLDEPWEGDLVAKVGPKIFAFLGAESVGVKCARTREEADEWLVRFPQDAAPLAYIGRYGWNRLRFDGAIADGEVREAVDASYTAAVRALPRRERPSAE